MNELFQKNQIPAEKSSHSGCKVAAILRWTGSLTLAVSAISFLLQGLDEYVSGYRNWVIPGFIVILCGCGLICGYLMKETRGARQFFGLATAFLTVQLTQLGSMLYQYFAPVTGSFHPVLSWWRIDRLPFSTFALIVGVSVILALLVVPTGFAMLARTQARTLSSGFFVGNLLLMVPSRANIEMAIAAVLLYAGLRFVMLRCLARDPLIRTKEGIAAISILWLPLAIIGGRGFFYPEWWIMLCAMLGIVSVTLLIDVPSVVKSSSIRFLIRMLGVSSALAAWLIAATETLAEFPFLRAYETLWIVLPVAVLLHLVSYSMDARGAKYRAVAGLLASFTTFGFLLNHPDYTAAFISILSGIALASSGLKNKEKIPFISGIVLFLAGILFNLKFALEFYWAFPWASSAVLGLSVVLLASYVDSRERILLEKTSKAYQALKSWG